MNLILFGPPGAGKGTQANRIVKDFNLKQVSTGDLLREEIKFKSKLGKTIESIINSGKLVSDEIVYSLIEKVISDDNFSNKLIFDGYPRNLSQVYTLNTILKKFDQKISAVISLNVDKEIIIKRIKGRVTCTNCFKIFNVFFNPPSKSNHTCDDKYLTKRSDDNSDTIIKRYDTYKSQTKPILDYFRENSSFYEIDGNMEIDKIYNKINSILNTLRD